MARTLSYALLPGWPDPTTFNGVIDPFGENGRWAAVFRNGQIVAGTSRMLLTQPIGSGLLTLTQDGTPWTQASTLATLQPGDTIVVAARGGGGAILVWEGDGVTISNVTLQGTAETAIQFYSSKNSTADNVRVVPRPVTGLVGSVGDAIHFVSTRENNHIVNSYAARTLDDGLVMDNQHAALVISQTPPRQLRVRRDQYLRFPDGTPVNFVDPSTTLESPLGAVIVAQNPPDGLPQFNEVVDLTFDRDLPVLPAGMAMVYADPLTRGQGSSITDSTAEDTYAGRGIWIAGLRGLTIERNTVRRSSSAGIILSTSTDPFDTGDIGAPSHDVIIRNNLVEDAPGPAAPGTGTQVGLAAIQVVSLNNQQFGFASAGGNTNISIVDNVVLNAGHSGIWVGEVSGGVIQGNAILGHNRHPELAIFGVPPPFAAQVASDFAVPLVVRYSAGVTKQGNVIRPTLGLRDLSGDARSDLLWTNGITGATAVWLMNGTAAVSASTILADANWHVTHTGDLNADGRTDLVWRNGVTGQTAAWLMNGTTPIASAILFGNPNWAVTHTGDFNGDGMTDLVWRNNTTGATAIWLMNGLSATSAVVILTSPDWSVTHVGDFNGDGKDDLLWRNAVTGQVALWLMDGTAATSAAILFGDPKWAVAHTGDFNGDGRMDLVWRNSTTGATALWLMDGLTTLSSGLLFTSLDWSVTHVADFNGDGKDDLVWRNAATGQTALWLQDGMTTTGSAVLSNDPHWQVTHTGDHNGDRKADLAWRNTFSGAVAIWLMNGTTALGSAIELLNPAWTLSPASGL